MEGIEYHLFGIETAKLFSFLHKKDIPASKFKVGDKVRYVGRNFLFALNREYTISGVNENDDTFEYSLYNFPYLVWEEELK